MEDIKCKANHEKFSKYSDDCMGILHSSSFFDKNCDVSVFRSERPGIYSFNKRLKYLKKNGFVLDDAFFEKLYSAFSYVCHYGRVDSIFGNKFSGFVYDKNGMRYYLWITINSDGIVFNSQCFDTKSNEVLNLCGTYENLDDKCSYNIEYDLNYNVDKDIYSHNIATLVSNGYEVSSLERNSFKNFFEDSYSGAPCISSTVEENQRVRDCNYVIENRSSKVDVSNKDGVLIETSNNFGTFIGVIDKERPTSLKSSQCYLVDKEIFDCYLNGKSDALDIYNHGKESKRVRTF